MADINIDQTGGAGGDKLSADGFMKTVFNFDEESKGEILNIIQYAVLCIIPVVILNKIVNKYIPPSDENKGSLEIGAEIIAQLIVMFVGLMLIHRIVTYVPTYSEYDYDKLNFTNIILVFMMLLFSLQTKLGEKVNILFDRVGDLWEGNTTVASNHNSGHVRVTQPGITNPLRPQNIREGMTSSRNDATNIASLPQSNGVQNQMQNASQIALQAGTGPSVDFNNMYGYNGSQQQEQGNHPGVMNEMSMGPEALGVGGSLFGGAAPF